MIGFLPVASIVTVFVPLVEKPKLYTHKYTSKARLVSKGVMSSIEDHSSIEDTFQPYVHSRTIRPIKSLQPQACSPSLEIYQLSRVLDDSDTV